MIDTLNTLQRNETLSISQTEANEINYWLLIAIVQLIIILILLINLNRKRKQLALSQISELANARINPVDMGALMNDITLSRELFKELSSSCHPDRFTDVDLKKKADALFQEITKNKRSYSSLISLKKRAKDELNLNFNDHE